MTNNARRSGVALLASLALVSTGCMATPKDFTHEIESSAALPAPVRLEQPVRIGLRPHRGRYAALHAKTALALKGSDSVRALTTPYTRTATTEVDAVVAVRHRIETSAKLYNGLICFPGFVFFLPQVVRLRWDWKVTTEIELWRGTTGARIGKLITRTDVYHMAYTSASYNSLSHAGWGALLLTPFAGFPLVTGVVAMFAAPDPRQHAADFAGSLAGREHARRTTSVILAAIQADQAEAVTEWRLPTRPELKPTPKQPAK